MIGKSIYRIKTGRWIDLSHIVSISPVYLIPMASETPRQLHRSKVVFKIDLMLIQEPMNFELVFDKYSHPEYITREDELKLIDGTVMTPYKVLVNMNKTTDFQDQVVAVAETKNIVNEIVTAWKQFKGEE